MWNNFGGGTVPQPQPQAQVCSMVVRVSSEQEGRAFLVQRGLTQLMTNLDDSEFYAKTVFIDGREHFEKFPRQPFVQETQALTTSCAKRSSGRWTKRSGCKCLTGRGASAPFPSEDNA